MTFSFQVLCLFQSQSTFSVLLTFFFTVKICERHYKLISYCTLIIHHFFLAVTHGYAVNWSKVMHRIYFTYPLTDTADASEDGSIFPGDFGEEDDPRCAVIDAPDSESFPATTEDRDDCLTWCTSCCEEETPEAIPLNDLGWMLLSKRPVLFTKEDNDEDRLTLEDEWTLVTFFLFSFFLSTSSSTGSWCTCPEDEWRLGEDFEEKSFCKLLLPSSPPVSAGLAPAFDPSLDVLLFDSKNSQNFLIFSLEQKEDDLTSSSTRTRSAFHTHVQQMSIWYPWRRKKVNKDRPRISCWNQDDEDENATPFLMIPINVVMRESVHFFSTIDCLESKVVHQNCTWSEGENKQENKN